jgi:hypothetical protein
MNSLGDTIRLALVKSEGDACRDLVKLTVRVLSTALRDLN